MERHRDHHLHEIRQKLLEMGGIVEQMIADAMSALTERLDDLAQQIIERDAEVDRLEKTIDEGCHTVLARHQPTAGDLRFLLAVMKIVNDLERMGDCAKNIARSCLIVNRQPPLKPYIDLPRMSKMAREMVHGSLNSFVERNSELAREIWVADDKIDELYVQIFRELLTYMIENPNTAEISLHLQMIAQNLERIADHATNVCEDVVYYVEGTDIRHAATDYSARSR